MTEETVGKLKKRFARYRQGEAIILMKTIKEQTKKSVIKVAKEVAVTALAAMMIMSSAAAAFAAGPGGGQEGPGGQQSSSSVSWSGATEITSGGTYSGKTFSSSSADQNAVLIDTSDSVTLKNPTVTKTGGSSASDNYSFYGINSGVMCKGGGTTTITGGSVTTNAEGANGIFSYGKNNGTTNATGDGTTVNITDTTITTTKGGSGGIMTTYGGTTNAKNLTVTTSGGSSAPIRTDRGGGWVTVKGGSYTSSGTGSPAIYSTADVDVTGATLVSKASEGTCIEGTGSIELSNCELTATNNKLNGNAQFYDTIMIYQSMSGDASSGTSAFSMNGGTLTSNNGHVFHVTNTSCTIDLRGVDIVNNDSDNVLISVCDDGWSGGSNKAVMSASDQVLEGNILVGSDSALDLTLSNGSSLAGKTSGSITNAKGSNVSSSLGTVNVTLGSGCLWELTGDCTVSSLSGSGMINYNGHTLTVGSRSYSRGSIGNITETNEPAASSTKSVSFKNTTKTFKYSALKKSKKSFSVIKASGGGAVTYKVTKGTKKYIGVSKTGKVTVKQGAKKGIYKVKINVAAAGGYKETSKTIKIKVK